VAGIVETLNYAYPLGLNLLDLEKLNGRKVLVTGADGFIGSHLVELLVSVGADVRAMVYYNSWQSKGWLADCSSEVIDVVEIFAGDVRDPERTNQAVMGCEIVYHLSSLIAIPYSYEAAHSYVQTNVVGGLNILEACRRNDRLSALIHVSTSETYGTAQSVPISEEHPLVGQSPYSASKIAADMMAESYFRSFDLPVVIARPFNTYGPRQTARAVIPTIACQLLAGVSKLKLGMLTPTRDFNFVSDTAAGLLALSLCSEAIGEVVNIGTGREWSIGETVDMLVDIIGHEVEILSEEARIRPEKSEVHRLVADNAKIKSLTNWSPEVEFRDGLSLTVDWIRQNAQHFDIDSYAI
jgi:NAD dependent epimerase/dehydratase